MDTASTFPDLLASRLRAAPAQPLLTAYDDATGERTELSAVTFANWVSKTGNLLVEELDLEPGDTLLVDLPVHWLVPVFLGGAWSTGVRVTTDAGVAHDAVVCGPGSVAAHASAPSSRVLACSLRPFATRFVDALPAGVLDHGVLWAGQSDVLVPLEPVDPGTPAWAGASGETQGELLERARGAAYDEGVRLLTDRHPTLEGGVPAFLGPLVHAGSVVLVAHPETRTWPARREDERATAELGGPGTDRSS